MISAITLAAAVGLALLASTGCAFLDRDNTPTFNLVEKHLWPETPGRQVLAAPAVVPLGVGAILLDAFIVHPATVIDDAWDDTHDALWDEWNWDEHYMTECAGLPWRVVLSPLFFGGDFLGRSMFDIPDRAEQERVRAQNQEMLAETRRLFEEGNYEEVLKSSEQLRSYRLDQADQDDAAAMEFIAAYRAGLYEKIFSTYDPIAVNVSEGAFQSGHGAEANAILKEMAASPNALLRWMNLSIRLGPAKKSGEGPAGIARIGLQDEHPIVRSNMVKWIRRNGLEWDEKRSKRVLPPELKSLLESVAADDPDLMVRTEAEMALREAVAGVN